MSTILKPNKTGKMVTVRAKVTEEFLDELKAYAELAGFKNPGEVLSAAAEHVIAKDRAFQKAKKSAQPAKAPAAAGDQGQGNPAPNPGGQLGDNTP